MMEVGYFVIAILGCADGGSACTPVATLQTPYATEAQCNAAAPAVLMDNSDFDYPTLIAHCRTANPKMANSDDARGAKRRRG